MSDTEYIPVEDVANLLGVKTRQAHRYGEGSSPRIRTKMVGHRKLFHRGDTEALATERQETTPTRAKSPRTELVPIGDILDYIKERDRQLEDLQRQLTEAAAQIGYLRGQLEQRMLPTEAEKLRQEVEALKQERDTLRTQLKPQQKSWWVRWLRRKMS